MQKIVIILTLSAFGCTGKTSVKEAKSSEVKMEKAIEKSIGVDVRSLEEIKENPAPGSTHIEMSDVAEKFETKFTDKTAAISIFCEVGGRADRAKEFLETKGYTAIKNIGSWRDWNKINGQ